VPRTTERVGEAYEAVQTAAVEIIEQTLPPAPVEPAVQMLSVDGAMGPLVQQAWVEVKTLALGSVGKPVCERGEWLTHAQKLSYFSRLADVAAFRRLVQLVRSRDPNITRQARGPQPSPWPPISWTNERDAPIGSMHG
jgi:hypothetical protein